MKKSNNMKDTNKKKKFTFVYPDFEYTVTKHGLKTDPGGWYHEGIAQLAAIIEELGWEVSLIHFTDKVNKKEFLAEVKKHNPDVLGFSVRTGVRDFAEQLIKWSSDLNIFTIVGSYHATLWPNRVIAWKGVDAICIGEGENPVKDLIKNFGNFEKVKKIGSLWVKDKKGHIYRNNVQNVEADLDSLPLPKFNIFDFSRLIPSQIKAGVVVLTRGCPYNCTYCWNSFAKNLCPNKKDYIRTRSPQNCIDYIKQLEKHYPDLRSFRFQDDLWPFHSDWFPKFSTLYIKKVNKPFECHLRANLMTEEIIKRLKEMQCNGCYFGVESGNDYIRNQILKRGMNEKTIITAFLTCKKYGIRTHAYNIVGIPHENMSRVLDTVKLNAKLFATDMFFPVFFPYAGTELYNIAVRNGFFDPNAKLDPYVNIEMPDFKRDQIRFASLYSKTFVSIYKFVNKLPGKIKSGTEKFVDSLWLYPHWPFRILNNWVVFKRHIENKIKVFIKTHFFNLYLFLKK